MGFELWFLIFSFVVLCMVSVEFVLIVIGFFLFVIDIFLDRFVSSEVFVVVNDLFYICLGRIFVKWI